MDVASLAAVIETKGVGKAQRQLRQFDKTGKQVGRTYDKVGRNLRNLFAAAGAVLGVREVIRGVRAAGQAFIDFDSAMTKSLAIMGDISVALREDMAAAARTVSKETTFSATQAAESYFFLASAGLDARQSVAALPTVARFAQAGMFDMAQATDLLTDAQSALGLTIRDDVIANMENMARVADVLAKANVLANATVEQFSQALTSEAGAALKSFNIDVEEGVAVLAAFADQGVKAQTAGTGLSRILRLVSSAAVNNSDAMRRLGIAAFDQEGNFRNLADIIADMENAFSTMSDAQRVAALESIGFRARVQGIILPLIGTSEAIRRYETELRAASGTTKEIADKQLQSFSAQLKLTKNAVNTLVIGFVDAVARSMDFREMLKSLRDSLANMERWVYENDIAISQWVQTVASAAAVAAAFASLMKDTVVATFRTFGNVLGNIGVALFAIFTGDFNLMRTAISTLAEDFVADTQPIRDRLQQLAGEALQFGAALRAALGGGGARRGGAPATAPGGGAVGLPSVAVTEPVEGIGADILRAFQEMADTLERGIEQTLGDAVFNAFSAAFSGEGIAGIFEAFGKTILAGFGDVLIQLGKQLIAYGVVMAKLMPFLLNIFTSGPAAIAAGAALIALGSAFTSIASGSGGTGRGTAGAGAFREPVITGPPPNDVTSRTITLGSQSGTASMRPAPTQNFWIIGTNDPRAQRELAGMVAAAQRRGVR